MTPPILIEDIKKEETESYKDNKDMIIAFYNLLKDNHTKAYTPVELGILIEAKFPENAEDFIAKKMSESEFSFAKYSGIFSDFQTIYHDLSTEILCGKERTEELKPIDTILEYRKLGKEHYITLKSNLL